MGIRLLSNRIAVRPDEATSVSAGGIQLIREEKVSTGTVAYVGPGAYDEKGNLVPVALTVGDRITYMLGNEQKIDLDGEDLLIMTEDDILALHTSDD